MKSGVNSGHRLWNGVRDLARDDRNIAAVIGLFFAVGIIGHVVLPRAMKFLTPPVLWVYGILTVILATREAGSARTADGSRIMRIRLVSWVLVTYVLTFVLEAVGTATGMVFGPYTYGSALGFMLFNVPLVIGFNWVLVVLGGLRITQDLPPFPAVMLTALITTGFDYLMEPVAIHLDYWTWHWDGIPPQNYLAWFVTSLAAASAFRILGLRCRNRLPAYYLGIQAVFFAAIQGLVLKG